jgi:hypothetical protein
MIRILYFATDIRKNIVRMKRADFMRFLFLLCVSVSVLCSCRAPAKGIKTTEFVWMGRLDTWGMPGTPRFAVELTFNELQVIRVENAKEVERLIIELSDSEFREFLEMWKNAAKGMADLKIPNVHDGTSASIAYQAGKEYYLRGLGHISSVKDDPLIGSLVQEINRRLPDKSRVY